MMTLTKLNKLKQSGNKIVCLTAYDAAFGHCLSEAGVDVILVGDSLGMVVQGHTTTLPVTLDDMVYHTQMVQRGNKDAWCIADIPFMADGTLASTLHSVQRLMKEGQANMVKLEGGERVAPLVAQLSALGVPVCGHLGLLPQSVQKKGYKVVGRDDASADKLLSDALLLESQGLDMLVLECVPASLAKKVSLALSIPVIGIGSGADTDGQVLVLHDILGLTLGKPPTFSKNFMVEATDISGAITSYVDAVRNQLFPANEHVLVH